MIGENRLSIQTFAYEIRTCHEKYARTRFGCRSTSLYFSARNSDAAVLYGLSMNKKKSILWEFRRIIFRKAGENNRTRENE